jgi:hypothetical protein
MTPTLTGESFAPPHAAKALRPSMAPANLCAPPCTAGHTNGLAARTRRWRSCPGAARRPSVQSQRLHSVKSRPGYHTGLRDTGLRGAAVHPRHTRCELWVSPHQVSSRMRASIGRASALLAASAIAAAAVSAATATQVTISNVVPRRSTDGAIMDAHDGNILYDAPSGLYYWYAASYGNCTEPTGPSGCSDAGPGACEYFGAGSRERTRIPLPRARRARCGGAHQQNAQPRAAFSCATSITGP